jgi:hypothetical protein
MPPVAVCSPGEMTIAYPPHLQPVRVNSEFPSSLEHGVFGSELVLGLSRFCRLRW